MRIYLEAQGADVWKIIVNAYDIPPNPPIDAHSLERKNYEDNLKAMNAILSSPTETIFVKVMHYETMKEIWDKLKNIYEGDDKVKGAKLQTYRG